MTQRLSMFRVLCSFWISIPGCGTNHNPPAPAAIRDIIIPLSVGNQWIYLVTDGTASSSRCVRDTVMSQISHDTTIQNEKWYVVESHSHPSIPSGNTKKYSTILWLNRTDGLWAVPLRPGMQFPPCLVVKYPASVNDSWQIHGWLDSDIILTPTLVSPTTRVDVPAGQFVCNKIEYRDSLSLLPAKSYYAINIGLIKSEPEPGETIREELLSYTILKMSTQ
jgi:hypothetical protein